MMKLLLLAAALAACHGFAPKSLRHKSPVARFADPPDFGATAEAPVNSSSDSSSDTNDFDVSSLTAKAKDLDVGDLANKAKDVLGNIQNIDLSGITSNTEAIFENVMSGQFGQRGEQYVAVQLFLGACILLGGVPIVGDTAMLLLGPGCLIGGLAIMVLSVNDLGGALSPWPVPAENNSDLKTDGLYSEMRHPIYAGLLYACLGLSVTTGSAVRLLLTAAFLYGLDVKSDYEEKELIKMYPEYEEYMQRVPSKFVPETIVSVLPWKE